MNPIHDPSNYPPVGQRLWVVQRGEPVEIIHIGFGDAVLVRTYASLPPHPSLGADRGVKTEVVRFTSGWETKDEALEYIAQNLEHAAAEALRRAREIRGKKQAFTGPKA